MTYLLLFSFDGKVTKSDMGRDILHSLVRAVTDSPDRFSIQQKARLFNKQSVKTYFVK